MNAGSLSLLQEDANAVYAHTETRGNSPFRGVSVHTTFLKETYEFFTLRCALASAACFTNGSHSWNWKPLPIIDFNIIVSIPRRFVLIQERLERRITLVSSAIAILLLLVVEYLPRECVELTLHVLYVSHRLVIHLPTPHCRIPLPLLVTCLHHVAVDQHSEYEPCALVRRSTLTIVPKMLD